MSFQRIEEVYLSVIVPCYNEEAGFQYCYTRLKQVLNGLPLRNYEIIIVDDGSKDNTLLLAKETARTDTKLKVLSFSRNFGHQAAVTAGLHHCKGDCALIIDADLQDPPEIVGSMLEVMQQEQCNVVYGVRKTRKSETMFKKTSARWFYRILNWLSDVRLAVDTGDFRLIDRKVIDAVKLFKERNKYLRGLFSWMGFHQVPFYYDREARLYGETKYPFKKMLKLASIAMFYFSKKPLKLALNLGLFSLLVGLFLIFVVFFKLFSTPEDTVPGWASLTVTVIFFGGVQLITLGVLGEYIGNIFDEVKNRPEYLLNTKINLDGEE